MFSLHADRHGWLASDRRVYAADEVDALRSAIDCAERLSTHLGEVVEREAEACRLARADAERSGYAEGLARGRADAWQTLADTLVQLRALGEKNASRDRADIVDLALGIVRKVAGAVAPEQWLAAQVERALDQLDRPSGVRLLLGTDTPHDLVRGKAVPTGIDAVVVDPSVPSRACVLETAVGRVHIDLESQLAEIRQWLRPDVES